MFLLGLLGLLQMTILPGWVWLRAAKVHTQNRIEEGVYCFAASLIWNHVLVYFFTLAKINVRTAWLVVIAVEVATLVLLASLRGVRWSRPKFEIINPDWWQTGSLSSIGSAGLAAVTIAAIIQALYQNWGTVFSAIDDVLSWDRWARDWFQNRFPEGTLLYPQLLPANWSIIYALMDNSHIKMFAKASMPLFSLFLLILFVSLALRKKDWIYLLGCFMTGFLIFCYLPPDFVTMGYADIPSAFFAFLPFYVLYSDSAPFWKSQAGPLALFFAAGAGVTKQGALVALGAVIVYLILTRTKNPSAETPRPSKLRGVKARPQVSAGPIGASRTLVWTSWVAVAFVALWYGPYLFRMATGTAVSNVYYLTHDIHQGRGFFERIQYTGHLFVYHYGPNGVTLFATFLILALSGVLFQRTRAITLAIIIPFYLLWASLFGYEIRTGTMMFPFVGLVCGITAQLLLHHARLLFEKIGFHFDRLPGSAAFIVVGVLLSCAGFLLREADYNSTIRVVYMSSLITVGLVTIFLASVRTVPRLQWGIPTPAFLMGGALLFGAIVSGQYKDEPLLAQQLEQQRHVGDFEVNQALYRAYGAGHLNGLLLTKYYFLSALPILDRVKTVDPLCSDCGLSELLAAINKNPEIQSYLGDVGAFPGVEQHRLDHCPGVETIFQIGHTSLLRIDRLRFDGKCQLDPALDTPLIERLIPFKTKVGVAFNVQVDRTAALSVGCRRATRETVVVWNGIELKTTFGGPTAVTAYVPNELFAKAGSYPIQLVDKYSGLKSPPAIFEVTK